MIKKGWYLLIPLLLLGCTSPPVFEGETTMENEVWNRFNFLIFEVPVEDNSLLDFYLKVDFTEDYPSDNLTTNITFYASDGSMRSSNYEFPLSESTLTGKKPLQHLFTIRKEMLFTKGGTCEVRVENKSSKVHTKGVSSVGIVARRSAD